MKNREIVQYLEQKEKKTRQVKKNAVDAANLAKTGKLNEGVANYAAQQISRGAALYSDKELTSLTRRFYGGGFGKLQNQRKGQNQANAGEGLAEKTGGKDTGDTAKFSAGTRGVSRNTGNTDRRKRDLQERMLVLVDRMQTASSGNERRQLEKLYRDLQAEYQASGGKTNNGKFLAKSLHGGLGRFNQNLAEGIDFLLPTEALTDAAARSIYRTEKALTKLAGKEIPAEEFDSTPLNRKLIALAKDPNANPIDRALDYYKKDAGENLIQEARETAEEYDEALGSKGYGIADELIGGTVAALPQAVAAMMSAGGSAAAGTLQTAGKALSKTPGIAKALSAGTEELLKKPTYWTSFLTTAGGYYEDAKADGAKELPAICYAMLTGLTNAAVEVGGGLEGLPEAVQTGGKPLLQWIQSALDEGKEEVIQGVIERANQILYGKKNALVSTESEDAIINPGRMGQEFSMGAAVGGVLSGGMLGVRRIAAGVNGQKNAAAESSGRAESRRLNEGDIISYLNAGTRQNKNKTKALQEGKRIILTTPGEIAAFIRKAVHKATDAPENIAAYGRVNRRLSEEIKTASKGKIDVTDYYLELNPYDLRHAYENHTQAKEEGDIDLAEENFENIPDYLDDFDELIYVRKYAGGRTHFCVGKTLENGKAIIIEVVSKSRGSAQFKNIIGLSKEKYAAYVQKEKGTAANSRGSKNSNTSLRDANDSFEDSIAQGTEKVNPGAERGTNNENILYTKNNESIQQLLTVRLQLPEARADDTLINYSIAQGAEKGNPAGRTDGVMLLPILDENGNDRNRQATPGKSAEPERRTWLEETALESIRQQYYRANEQIIAQERELSAAYENFEKEIDTRDDYYTREYYLKKIKGLERDLSDLRKQRTELEGALGIRPEGEERTDTYPKQPVELESGVAVRDTDTDTIYLEDAAREFEETREGRIRLNSLLNGFHFTQAEQDMVRRIANGNLGLEEAGIENPRRRTLIKYAADELRRLNAASQNMLRQGEEVRRRRQAEAEDILQNSDQWKDKKTGLGYSAQTAERNLYDIIPEEEDAKNLIDRYFTPVHQNESDNIRWKNEMRDWFREIREKHHLTKEEMTYFMMQNRLETGPEDAALAEQAAEYLAQHRERIDEGKYETCMPEFYELTETMYGAIHETYLRNGYGGLEHREKYIPSYVDTSSGSPLAKVLRVFGITVDADKLPTDIAGKTAERRPGRRWFSAANQRTGNNTDFDLEKAFDGYIEVAGDVIFHTEDICKIRALEDAVRAKYGTEGGNAVEERINYKLSENQNVSLEPGEKNNYQFAQLSNFANWLKQYGDSLAGKKNIGDRNLEDSIGRGLYQTMNNVERRIASNLVGFNANTALTNFIPLTQGGAELSPKNFWKAAAESARNLWKDNGFSGESWFLNARAGSDRIAKSGLDKAADVGFWAMSQVDKFAANTLVRGRYYDNVAKKMDRQAAMTEANQWAAGVMADRSKGGMPLLFESKNPAMKVFSMFQLEVANQYGYLFKDVPRNNREKGLLAIAAKLFAMFLMGHLFNDAVEKLSGNRPAFDPIQIINEAIGAGTGYQLPNAFDAVSGILSGEGVSFSAEQQEAADVMLSTAKNIGEELPFVGGLLGGGRVPISAALPDFGSIVNTVFSEDSREKKTQDIVNDLVKPASNLLLPFGANQVKKTLEGLHTVSRGGAYKTDAEGRDILLFPILDKSAGKTVQAALFGKNALPDSKIWKENGYKNALGADGTALYQSLLSDGVEEKQAFAAVKELYSFETSKNDKGETIRTKTEQIQEYLNQKKEFTAQQKREMEMAATGSADAADYSSDAAFRASTELPKEQYQKAKQMGVDYDAYRKAYRAYQRKTSSGDESGAEQFRRYMMNMDGLDAKEKQKISSLISGKTDKTDYTDEMTFALTKDGSEDALENYNRMLQQGYGKNEAFTICKLSDSAQKKYPKFKNIGVGYQEYEELWSALYRESPTNAEVKARLSAMGYSEKQMENILELKYDRG